MIHTHFIHVIHFPALFWPPISYIVSTFRYLFWAWDMKSEACRFEKSFEHSPKASKQQLYIIFNDLSIEIDTSNQKCRKSILTHDSLRKKNTLIANLKPVLLETF